MSNHDYFKRKEERKKLAIKQYETCKTKYEKEIQHSINTTKVYDDERVKSDSKNYVIFNLCNTEIILSKKVTEDAISKYKFGNTSVLNFASYKNPGGMFIVGSSAQEESLCHKSFLYNVLENFNDTYYDWNRKHLNRALYTNRALFSPDIIFNDNDVVSVITCAAPNYGAARRFDIVSDVENKTVLKNRIRFVLSIAKLNNVETLILGAFGCGVFRQSANVVATYFMELLQTEFKGIFKRIIFAVPYREKEHSNSMFNSNYNDFKKVIDNFLGEHNNEI